MPDGEQIIPAMPEPQAIPTVPVPKLIPVMVKGRIHKQLNLAKNMSL